MWLTLCLLLCLTEARPTQQPPSGAAPQQPGAGRRAPVPDDDAGFLAIFDGRTLKDWDGDPAFWRVENGAIVAESTPEKVVRQNTFLIWQGGKLADFELKLEFRLSEAANSGVQYRSVRVPELGPWAMRGYQADIDGRHTFTGMVYEERGRGFLAPRGQIARVSEDGTRKLIGSPGDPDTLRTFLKAEDWNQLHIIARGNVLVHLVNGRLMSLLVDEDPKGRSLEGLLGLQLHAGKPMRVEFRNILLRRL